MGDLVQTFPVVGRVQALAEAAQSSPVARDPHERRRRAFVLLGRILDTLANRQPVILWIDDAQWSDDDSADGLAAMMSPDAAPRVLLLVAHRPTEDDAEPPALLDVATDEAPRRVRLSPLSADATRELARTLLLGVEEDRPSWIEAVTEFSGGSPFLAHEMARAVVSVHQRCSPRGDGDDEPSALLRARTFDELLGRRLARMPADWLDVLEVLAAASGPLALPVLEQVLASERPDLSALEDARLVTLSARRGVTFVEIYHHALAEAVAARLDGQRIATLRSRLIRAFLRHPAIAEGLELDSWLNNDDVENAAEVAYQLAEASSSSSAFLRSAHLYERAIQLGLQHVPRWMVMAKRASCLVNAGRSVEAGEAFAAAAEELAHLDPSDPGAISLRRRAATELLRGGADGPGVALLVRALDGVGVRYPRHLAVTLGWMLLDALTRTLARWVPGSGSRRVNEAQGEAEAERLELLWGAGQGLSFADITAAAAFQARHSMAARRLGSGRHQSRSLSTRAMFLAWSRGDPARSQSDELFIEADRLAEDADDPLVTAHARLMRGVALLSLGDFKTGLTLAREGEIYCKERCEGAAWERSAFQQNVLIALAYLGRAREGARLTQEYLMQAGRRGDAFAVRTLPAGPANMSILVAEGPASALARIEQSVGPAFEESSPWYLWQGGLARCQIDLVTGRVERGLADVEEVLRRLRSSFIAQLPSMRYILHDLRARCALRLAEREAAGSGARRRLVRLALRCHRRIDPRRVRWLGPYAHRTLGLARALEGDLDGARRHLQASALGFRRQDMVLHEAALRFRLSELPTQGDPGAAQRQALAVIERECRHDAVAIARAL